MSTYSIHIYFSARTLKIIIMVISISLNDKIIIFTMLPYLNMVVFIFYLWLYLYLYFYLYASSKCIICVLPYYVFSFCQKLNVQYWIIATEIMSSFNVRICIVLCLLFEIPLTFLILSSQLTMTFFGFPTVRNYVWELIKCNSFLA